MLRWNVGRTVCLVLGGLGVLGLVVQADSAQPLRQAARAESPDEPQRKQARPPASPQRLAKPSKADLVALCQRQPACRAQLVAAQKGQKPATVRPAAAGPSPEELELKKLLPPATPGTPRRAPRSGLGVWPLDGLVAWLNPLGPRMAEAESAVSVYLTVQHAAAGSNYLSLHGVTKNANDPYVWLLASVTTGSANAENKATVQTRFRAQTSGYYIIHHRASSAAAKLRHNHGGPLIGDWAPGSVPCSPQLGAGIDFCDYVTVEYLEQGRHDFYFYAPGTHCLFASVSIVSYP